MCLHCKFCQYCLLCEHFYCVNIVYCVKTVCYLDISYCESIVCLINMVHFVNYYYFLVHVISSSESEQKLYDVEAKRDETDGASHPVPGRVPLGFKASTEIAASSVSTHCLQSMSTGLTSISTLSTTSTTTTLSSLTSELLSNRLASTSQPSTSQWNYSTPLEHRIPTFVVDSAPDTPSFENEASARGLLSEYASATAAEEGEGFWGCLDADSGVSLDSDCPSSFDASQKTNPGKF